MFGRWRDKVVEQVAIEVVKRMRDLEARMEGQYEKYKQDTFRKIQLKSGSDQIMLGKVETRVRKLEEILKNRIATYDRKLAKEEDDTIEP